MAKITGPILPHREGEQFPEWARASILDLCRTHGTIGSSAWIDPSDSLCIVTFGRKSNPDEQALYIIKRYDFISLGDGGEEVIL